MFRTAALLLLLAPTTALAQEELVDLNARVHEAPQDVKLRLDRADALLSAGRFDEALVDCERAEEIDPRDADVSLTRARIYLALGELGLAEHYLSAHLKAGRPSAGALFLRGSIREETGRFEEALADYRAAVALESDAELQRSRRRMLRALGRLDDAVAWVRPAKE